MKCFAIKKFKTTSSGTTEEILHNTIFSTDTDAIKALKKDIDECQTPMDELIDFAENYKEMKTATAKFIWEVVEYEFNDGKM